MELSRAWVRRKRLAIGLGFLCLIAGPVLGWGMMAHESRSIDEAHRTFDRGVVAKARVTWRQVIPRRGSPFYRTTVTYADAAGVKHEGTVDLMRQPLAPEVRYDPERPDGWVLSSSLEAPEEENRRLRAKVFAGGAAVFGVVVALGFAFPAWSELSRVRDIASDGKEVLLAVIESKRLKGKSDSHLTEFKVRCGDRELTVRAPHDDVLYSDGTCKHLMGVVSGRRPEDPVLLGRGGEPFERGG